MDTLVCNPINLTEIIAFHLEILKHIHVHIYIYIYIAYNHSLTLQNSNPFDSLGSCHPLHLQVYKISSTKTDEYVRGDVHKPEN